MEQPYIYICPVCDEIEKVFLQPEMATTINIYCKLCLMENQWNKMQKYLGNINLFEEDLPQREKFQRKVKYNEWR